MFRYCVLSILVFYAFNSDAQQDHRHAAGFNYIEVVKNTDQTDADLPVIIGFHYSSSTPLEAADDYDQITFPVRIILPQGNFRKRKGYTYFPADYYTKDSLTQMTIAKQTVDSMAVFVETIVKKYNRKVVVAGFSQGGDISFLLAIYYPQLLKAAFPLAGFIHQQRLEEVKIHTQQMVPIEIYQGVDDKIVSVIYTQRMVGMLRNYFRISLKPYPGLGHDFSLQMKKDYAKRMKDFLAE
jgi:phospholipase/carboxylesterase